MSFTESNTVEQMILDVAISLGRGAGSFVVRDGLHVGGRGVSVGVFKWSRALECAIR